MQNIEQKISQYLKERKYRKRGRIAAAVMSIAVVISVFAGLIMPAVSMTYSSSEQALQMYLLHLYNGIKVYPDSLPQPLPLQEKLLK